MDKQLQPHEFVAIKEQVIILNKAFNSVNDKNVKAVVQADVVETVKSILPDNEIATDFLNQLPEIATSRQRAESAFKQLVELVTPFPELSSNQLGKLFKKVKKLPEPKWENLDRHEMTYLGWNDNGSQKKYIVAPRDGKLVGIYGDFDPKPLNGLCAICHQLGTVSMFLSKVKSRGADGNYTKRGNLICRDSSLCNAQLSSLDHLASFVETTLVK